MNKVKVVALCSALAGLAGCATANVRTRAAYDFKCPEDKIQVQDLIGSSVVAHGCGKTATYVVNPPNDTPSLNSEIQADEAVPKKPAAAPSAGKD